MDQRTWLQRKRSSEKSIASNDEAGISVKGNKEEKLPYKKEAALGRPVKNLHEKIASLLGDYTAKDELVAKHANTAQESNTGREKTKGNERLVLNAALKDCMQQLSSLKLEQDQRVKLERAYKRLESKYTEARKKLVNLTVENALLTKALVTKEEIIENVNNQISQAKYEYHVLEREFKKRNPNADVDNNNQTKLEAERQKLRLLVRKRVPGHAKAVDKRLSLKLKRLSEVEEENKILKESACKREKEIRFLKTELARLRRDERNISGIDKDNLEAKLLESENSIIVMKNELERVKEWKRIIEDRFENMKTINLDLDDQLSVAKVQIIEAIQKLSFLEMELEDRSHRCEELEATCLELQFDLASFSRKDVANQYLEQEDKLLQTGSELTNNKNSSHCSLRDRMAMEDSFDTGDVIPCRFSNKQRSALRLVL